MTNPVNFTYLDTKIGEFIKNINLKGTSTYSQKILKK